MKWISILSVGSGRAFSVRQQTRNEFAAAATPAKGEAHHGPLWLAPRLPRFFRHNSAPMFGDATLPFAEKVSRWLAEPKTAVELLTNVR